MTDCANCEKLKSENATLRAELEEAQAENMGLAKALDRIAYALSDAAKVLEPTPIKDTVGACPLLVPESVPDTTPPELTEEEWDLLCQAAVAPLGPFFFSSNIKRIPMPRLIEMGLLLYSGTFTTGVTYTLTPAGREAVERHRRNK